MAYEQIFRVPKHNTLKLGKAFDLDTLATDTYQVILLASITGLTLEDLDTFDTEMEALECDPNTDYTRTNIALELNETVNGYQINVTGASVTIPIAGATINGILIINTEANDILAAALEGDNITLSDDLTLVFGSPIWEIGEQVCTI